MPLVDRHPFAALAVDCLRPRAPGGARPDRSPGPASGSRGLAAKGSAPHAGVCTSPISPLSLAVLRDLGLLHGQGAAHQSRPRAAGKDAGPAAEGEIPEVVLVPRNFLRYHWVGGSQEPLASSSLPPDEFCSRVRRAEYVVPMPELDLDRFCALLSQPPGEWDGILSSRENPRWDALMGGGKGGSTDQPAAVVVERTDHFMTAAGTLRPDSPGNFDQSGIHPVAVILVSLETMFPTQALLFAPVGCRVRRYRESLKALSDRVGILSSAYLESLYLSSTRPEEFSRSAVAANIRHWASVLRNAEEELRASDSAYRDPFSGPLRRGRTKGMASRIPDLYGRDEGMFGVIVEVFPGYGLERDALELVDMAFKGVLFGLRPGDPEPQRYRPIYTWRSALQGELDTLVRCSLDEGPSLDWHWCSPFPLLFVGGQGERGSSSEGGGKPAPTPLLLSGVLSGGSDLEPSEESYRGVSLQGVPDKRIRGYRRYDARAFFFLIPGVSHFVLRMYHILPQGGEQPPQPHVLARDSFFAITDFLVRWNIIRRASRLAPSQGGPLAPPSPGNDGRSGRQDHLIGGVNHGVMATPAHPPSVLSAAAFPHASETSPLEAQGGPALYGPLYPGPFYPPVFASASAPAPSPASTPAQSDLLLDALCRCVPAPGLPFHPDFWVPAEGSIVLRVIPHFQGADGTDASVFSQNPHLAIYHCNGVVYFVIRIPVCPTSDEIAEIVRAAHPHRLEVGESLGAPLLPRGETLESVRTRIRRISRVQSSSESPAVFPRPEGPEERGAQEGENDEAEDLDLDPPQGSPGGSLRGSHRPAPRDSDFVVDLSESAKAPDQPKRGEGRDRFEARELSPALEPASKRLSDEVYLASPTSPPSAPPSPPSPPSPASPAPTPGPRRSQTPAVYRVAHSDYEALRKVLGLPDR